MDMVISLSQRLPQDQALFSGQTLWLYSLPLAHSDRPGLSPAFSFFLSLLLFLFIIKTVPRSQKICLIIFASAGCRGINILSVFSYNGLPAFLERPEIWLTDRFGSAISSPICAAPDGCTKGWTWMRKKLRSAALSKGGVAREWIPARAQLSHGNSFPCAFFHF